MSYCVHCGVKLAAGEPRCPLCQTPVLDPGGPSPMQSPREWPLKESGQEMPIDRKATAGLIAILLGVPALICILVDLLVQGTLTWSLYAAGGALVALVMIVTPLLAQRSRFGWAVFAGDTALCLYLWMVEAVSGGGAWFETIVFPVLLLAGVMALATGQSIRQGLLKGLAVYACVLVEGCITALAVDLLTNSFLHGALVITWSAFVMIPCGLIAAMLLIVHHVKPLRQELKRKLHI